MKFLILGNSQSGKTSYLNRLRGNLEEKESPEPTGINLFGTGEEIIDTQDNLEKFESRGYEGVVILFDAHDVQGYNLAIEWASLLESMHVPAVLVENLSKRIRRVRSSALGCHRYLKTPFFEISVRESLMSRLMAPFEELLKLNQSKLAKELYETPNPPPGSPNPE